MPARNRREKAQFRDLCASCYTAEMEISGYILHNGMWAKKRINPDYRERRTL